MRVFGRATSMEEKERSGNAVHAQGEIALRARELTKSYGSHDALLGISLDVRNGEFVSLVGPSGCGKTTLLKIIAGLEDPTGGTLVIDGESMNGVPAMKRPTRMVFQSLALFPHKTVAENIGFPLKVERATADETAKRIQDIMQLMELPPSYLARRPSMLSGGERQRVALARALVSRPRLLLLDEPLTALDVKLRKVLQTELKRLHRNLGLTFILVTHDLEEALMLSDRICVMTGGRVLQFGPPGEIYYRPANRQVAGFIGRTNIFDAEVKSVSTDVIKVTCSDLFPDCITLPFNSNAANLDPGPAFLMLRPEQLMTGLGSMKHLPCQTLEVRINETFNRGATIHYECETITTAAPVILQRSGEEGDSISPGDRVQLSWSLESAFVFQED